MKKVLLLSSALALVASAVNAQDNWTKQSFDEVQFYDELYGEYWTVHGVFNHVSANGKYAVGCDDTGESTSTGGAFMWKLEKPTELEQLSTTSDRISACDVTNDGTIVGSFEKRDDPEKKVVCYPGYKPLGGEWVQLPVPEQYSTYFARLRDFAEEARAVTPDGKFIAGNFHYKTGEKDVLGQIVDVTVQPVIVWEKQGEEYVIKACYPELGKAGESLVFDEETGELKTVDHEVNYVQFLVRDISNDGSTVVGVNIAGTGAFNPAFVRDGKLVQLFNCGEESDPDETKNFNGGQIMTIDANGNMYGYYVDASAITKGFVYTSGGKLEWTDNIYSCASKDGVRFASSDKGLPSVLDCSEDGYVVVGAGIGANDLGQYNYPVLTYSDKATSSVDRLEAIRANVGVSFGNGGMLYVNGEYHKATVYNASGSVVAEGGQGKAFNLGANASGVYVVKVETASGLKTFKVAR